MPPPPLDTCWTIVHAAAAGDTRARSLVAHRYLDAVRAFLGKRWRGSALEGELEDAVQDVFVDLYRENGALSRLDGRSAFKTFLLGVARVVALRHEERRGTQRDRQRSLDSHSGAELWASSDEEQARAFDRAFARCLMQRATARQEAEAREPSAARRVELLRLRFADDLPIRDIAARWQVDAAHLYREYAKAREEWKRCLRAEVAFHHPFATAGEVERECRALLELIGEP